MYRARPGTVRGKHPSLSLLLRRSRVTLRLPSEWLEARCYEQCRAIAIRSWDAHRAPVDCFRDFHTGCTRRRIRCCPATNQARRFKSERPPRRRSRIRSTPMGRTARVPVRRLGRFLAQSRSAAVPGPSDQPGRRQHRLAVTADVCSVTTPVSTAMDAADYKPW